MASIKMGAIVTDIRGKLGGHVFQKGNQSRVLKTNIKPRQTSSQFNRALSKNLGEIRNAWNLISDVDRVNWNKIAPNFTFNNAFGDVLRYNGFQLFLNLNANNLKAGQDLVLTSDNLNELIVLPDLTSVEMDIALSRLLFTSIFDPDVGRIQYYIFSAKRGSTRVNANNFGYFWENLGFPAITETGFALAQAKVGIISANDSLYFGYKAISPSGFQSSLIWLPITFV